MKVAQRLYQSLDRFGVIGSNWQAVGELESDKESDKELSERVKVQETV